jgi:hypothetical protein
MWTFWLKIYGLTKWALEFQNGDLLEDGYEDFDPIKEIYGNHFLRQCHIDANFSKITLRVLEAQTRNADIVENAFTGWTDLIVVRYSETKNCYWSTFRLQGERIR